MEAIFSTGNLVLARLSLEPDNEYQNQLVARTWVNGLEIISDLWAHVGDDSGLLTTLPLLPDTDSNGNLIYKNSEGLGDKYVWVVAYPGKIPGSLGLTAGLKYSEEREHKRLEDELPEKWKVDIEGIKSEKKAPRSGRTPKRSSPDKKLFRNWKNSPEAF